MYLDAYHSYNREATRLQRNSLTLLGEDLFEASINTVWMAVLTGFKTAVVISKNNHSMCFRPILYVTGVGRFSIKWVLVSMQSACTIGLIEIMVHASKYSGTRCP
jgi:hypothetical protein